MGSKMLVSPVVEIYLLTEGVSRAPWLTAVNLATPEAEIGGSRFEASPGK
jgi:hypothetical protein